MKNIITFLALISIAAAWQPVPSSWRVTQPAPVRPAPIAAVVAKPVAAVAPSQTHVLTWRQYFHVKHSEEIILRDTSHNVTDKALHQRQVDWYITALSGAGPLRSSELDRPYTGPAL